jgi:RimJ/RimL family protein N-acetyltransferase
MRSTPRCFAGHRVTVAWTFTDEVDRYAERAWDLLSARAAENTLALTSIENLRRSRPSSEKPPLFGWYDEGGRVSGAVSRTPPYGVILSVVPDEALAGLALGLRARGADVPGVTGVVATVHRFVEIWTAGTALTAETTMSTRLYALHTLQPPAPPPAGRPRAARRDDFELSCRWFAAFAREAGVPWVDIERFVGEAIEQGLLWLWEDATGTVVSVAHRHRSAAGVARVGPVYTPAEHRRQGYGAAVTAACTADALHRDADQVVLFTDLANPTSNSIYQQIGYRPVGDHRTVRFRAAEETGLPSGT